MDDEKYIVDKIKDQNIYFDGIEYYIIVDRKCLAIEYDKNNK